MGTYTLQLEQLYLGYFGRPADPTGMAFWESVIESRMAAGADPVATLAGVAQYFGASPEFKDIYSGLSADKVVNKIYLNLFGRPAEPDGVLFWALQLQQGVVSFQNIVQIIGNSAQGADADAYKNRTTASTTFTTNLTTTDQILAYNGSTAIGIAKDYLNGVTDTKSLNTATKNIPDVINKLLGGSTPTPAPDSAPAGLSFTLTTGTDTGASYTGGGGDDTFTGILGAGATLTTGDTLDGGGGANVLNITDNAGGTALPGALAISNIQTVNESSAGAAIINTTTGFTGLTNLNVTQSTGADTVTAGNSTAISVTNTAQAAAAILINGGTSVNLTTTTTSNGIITVGNTTAPTGTVTVVRNLNGTGNTTGGAISLKGGTTVSLTINATEATNNTTTTAGSVTITGTANTTAVSVTETKAVTPSAQVAGIANGAITVTDVNYGSTTAGKITSITASGYTSLNINDSSLTNLSLANGSSNIIIDNSDAIGTPVTTLAVTINGTTGGTLDDADVYNTVNFTTAIADSRLANCTFGGATTMTVAGTKVLTFSSLAGLGALQTITISGAAGLTANTGIAGTVTSINASGTSGNNSVTINPTVCSFAGGSGVDKVTIGAVATKVIDGGAGTADEIIVNTATFATNPTKLINFETLGMGTAATGGTFDATGFAHLHVGGTITGASAFNHIAAGTDLTVDALLNKALTYTLQDATSVTTDAVTIHVGNATTAGLDITTATGSVVTTGVELVTIDSLGTGTGTNTLANTNAGALSLTVTGGEAITLYGFAGSSLTTINTSAATKLVDVSALTVAAAGVTVTGGAGGIKVFTGAGVDTVTGGTGADTIATSAGNDAIVGGGGADIITAGAGADSITISGNTSKIIQAAGDSGTNTSTTIQTAELTSTFDVVFGAVAGDKIDFGNANIVTGTLTTAATNLAAGVADTAVFARGAYSAAAGTFTYAANGADTAITYDSDVAGGVTAETIILVGYVSGASTAAAGVLTLV